MHSCGLLASVRGGRAPPSGPDGEPEHKCETKKHNYEFIFIKVSHFTAEVSIQAKSMCFFSNFAVTFA